MTRIRTLAAVALVFAAVPARADDLKDMVGTWVIEKATHGGSDVTAGPLKDVKMTIEAGGKYTTVIARETDKGAFTVDEKKAPKAMDIVSQTESPQKGKTLPAIYELKGDALTICYGMDWKTRPTKFESPAKSEFLLVVYKREKK